LKTEYLQDKQTTSKKKHKKLEGWKDGSLKEWKDMMKYGR
jgi:hypothetical protein